MKPRNLSAKKGVIGIDEVGRGPLAGPVTVCAVYLHDAIRVKKEIFNNIIRDSKRIKKDLRLKIYKTIRKNRKNNKSIKYAVISRSAVYIDKHGIQKATQACIDACIKKLLLQDVILQDSLIRTDAGIRVNGKDLKQKAYIKGDERFTEIALASILAKETRDAYMRRVGNTYLEYGWNENVGYGTSVHRKAIKKHGITTYHRRSYLKAFKLFDNIK